MLLHRSSTPPPFHRINPPYPSYYDMKAVELLSLHKVKIHKVYNFFYVIAEVDAGDTSLMTTSLPLKVKAELDDIQKKNFQKKVRSDILSKHQQNAPHIN